MKAAIFILALMVFFLAPMASAKDGKAFNTASYSITVSLPSYNLGTLCFWGNRTSTSDVQQLIISGGATHMIQMHSNGNIYWKMGGTTTNFANPTSIGQWNNYCVTWNASSTPKFYIDGSLRQTGNNGAATPADVWTFQGGGNIQIDEAVVFNRTLEAPEIQDVYNSGAGLYVDRANTFASTGAPIGENVTVIWHLDEGSGTLINDNSTIGDNDGSASGAAWANGYVDYTASDIVPPEIAFYNMTSATGSEGCTIWNESKSTPCTTTDTTPTVFIRTNENSNCSIGVSNINYTDMGNRHCAGNEATEHTCTLTAQDSLTEENSNLYISCKDTSGNQNLTSTSGALAVYIPSQNFEDSGREAIEAGVQRALPSGYTIYTSQKIYARNSANGQSIGVFDKAVKWMNKVWAFNYLTENQTAAGMFNITPALYVWEGSNMTFGQINNTVYNLITATK